MLREKLKAALRWFYDWITILTASLVGLPTLLLQFLSFVGAVDLSPIVGPQMALQIITGVAIAKAVLAFIESRVKAAAEAKAKAAAIDNDPRAAADA